MDKLRHMFTYSLQSLLGSDHALIGTCKMIGTFKRYGLPIDYRLSDKFTIISLENVSST